MKVALFEAVKPKKLGNIFYPLGLGYLASYLRKHIPGIEVGIFRTVDEIINFSPQIAGISSMSSNYGRAVFAAEKIKREVNCPVILGGSHISSIPETLPGDFTAGVIGEGEETFLEIARLYQRNKTPSRDDLAGIKGLVLKDGDNIHLTQKRELIANLDDVPFPAREWKYAYYNWTLTSRGCPYNCAFCFSALFWNTCRMNSPEYVVEELLQLSKMKGMSYHSFLDDLFTANIKRMEEISRLLKEKNIMGIHFTVTARANMVNEKMVEVLKSLGVEFVHLGLESGSERILKYLKRDECSVEINQGALDILSANGIKPIGTFIVGSPYETEEDLKKTYDFIKNNKNSGKLSSFSFGPLLPFPGTLIWDYAVSEGIINPETFDWEILDADVRSLDRDKYRILSGEVSKERFYYYFDKIKEMLDF